MQHYLRHKPNKGTALIMALGVIAIVTALSIIWFTKTQIIIKQTQQILTNQEMQIYADQVLSWAIKELKTTPSQDKFSLFRHGAVTGNIEVYESRLNINRLGQQDDQQAFIKLINLVDSSISITDATALTYAIMAWITPKSRQTPALKKINALYSDNRVTYQPPNRSIQSIDELKNVAGMPPTLLTKLSPYISALPSDVETNFYHAKQEILVAYNVKLPLPTTTDMSEYFLVTSRVTFRKQHLIRYNLLRRIKNADKVHIGIIW